MRYLVLNSDALLKQAVGSAQGDGLLAAKKSLRVIVGEDAGADAGFAVGIASDASGNGAGAVVLRLASLGLEAEAVGERPAARFDGLQQDGLLLRIARGIDDGGIHLIEEREVIQVALCVGQRSLVERIAGVKSDGAGHGLRTGEVEPGEDTLRTKICSPSSTWNTTSTLLGSPGSGCWATVTAT